MARTYQLSVVKNIFLLVFLFFNSYAFAAQVESDAGHNGIAPAPDGRSLSPSGGPDKGTMESSDVGGHDSIAPAPDGGSSSPSGAPDKGAKESDVGGHNSIAPAPDGGSSSPSGGPDKGAKKYYKYKVPVTFNPGAYTFDAGVFSDELEARVPGLRVINVDISQGESVEESSRSSGETDFVRFAGQVPGQFDGRALCERGADFADNNFGDSYPRKRVVMASMQSLMAPIIVAAECGESIELSGANDDPNATEGDRLVSGESRRNFSGFMRFPKRTRMMIGVMGAMTVAGSASYGIAHRALTSSVHAAVSRVTLKLEDYDKELQLPSAYGYFRLPIRDQAWKTPENPNGERVCSVTAWADVWRYSCLRDGESGVDVAISVPKGVEWVKGNWSVGAEFCFLGKNAPRGENGRLAVECHNLADRTGARGTYFYSRLSDEKFIATPDQKALWMSAYEALLAKDGGMAAIRSRTDTYLSIYRDSWFVGSFKIAAGAGADADGILGDQFEFTEGDKIDFVVTPSAKDVLPVTDPAAVTSVADTKHFSINNLPAVFAQNHARDVIFMLRRTGPLKWLPRLALESQVHSISVRKLPKEFIDEPWKPYGRGYKWSWVAQSALDTKNGEYVGGIGMDFFPREKTLPDGKSTQRNNQFEGAIASMFEAHRLKQDYHMTTDEDENVRFYNRLTKLPYYQTLSPPSWKPVYPFERTCPQPQEGLSSLAAFYATVNRLSTPLQFPNLHLVDASASDASASDASASDASASDASASGSQFIAQKDWLCPDIYEIFDTGATKDEPYPLYTMNGSERLGGRRYVHLGVGANEAPIEIAFKRASADAASVDRAFKIHFKVNPIVSEPYGFYNMVKLPSAFPARGEKDYLVTAPDGVSETLCGDSCGDRVRVEFRNEDFAGFSGGSTQPREQSILNREIKLAGWGHASINTYVQTLDNSDKVLIGGNKLFPIDLRFVGLYEKDGRPLYDSGVGSSVHTFMDEYRNYTGNARHTIGREYKIPIGKLFKIRVMDGDPHTFPPLPGEIEWYLSSRYNTQKKAITRSVGNDMTYLQRDLRFKLRKRDASKDWVSEDPDSISSKWDMNDLVDVLASEGAISEPSIDHDIPDAVKERFRLGNWRDLQINHVGEYFLTIRYRNSPGFRIALYAYDPDEPKAMSPQSFADYYTQYPHYYKRDSAGGFVELPLSKVTTDGLLGVEKKIVKEVINASVESRSGLGFLSPNFIPSEYADLMQEMGVDPDANVMRPVFPTSDQMFISGKKNNGDYQLSPEDAKRGDGMNRWGNYKDYKFRYVWLARYSTDASPTPQVKILRPNREYLKLYYSSFRTLLAQRSFDLHFSEKHKTEQDGDYYNDPFSYQHMPEYLRDVDGAKFTHGMTEFKPIIDKFFEADKDPTAYPRTNVPYQALLLLPSFYSVDAIPRIRTGPKSVNNIKLLFDKDRGFYSRKPIYPEVAGSFTGDDPHFHMYLGLNMTDATTPFEKMANNHWTRVWLSKGAKKLTGQLLDPDALNYTAGSYTREDYFKDSELLYSNLLSGRMMIGEPPATWKDVEYYAYDCGMKHDVSDFGSEFSEFNNRALLSALEDLCNKSFRFPEYAPGSST